MRIPTTQTTDAAAAAAAAAATGRDGTGRGYPGRDRAARSVDLRTGESDLHAMESRRQLAVAFDSAPIGMAVTTDAGLLVRANAALSELLGYPAGALAGRRLEDLAVPGVAAELTAGREQMIAEGTCQHVTSSQLRCASGRPVPVVLTCARVPGSQDGPAYLVVHVQDATKQQAAEAELSHRALHDPLTGLPNRVLLLDRLERALTRLTRSPSSVAVLFADLNGFKTVNDTHGHTVGDQVLVTVARRLQLLQRPGDTACRYGGDEFVVLCEDSGSAQADSVAKRLHAALDIPISWGSPDATGSIIASSVRLTTSIGISATSDPATTAHQLLHDADSTMYRAKQRTRSP